MAPPAASVLKFVQRLSTRGPGGTLNIIAASTSRWGNSPPPQGPQPHWNFQLRLRKLSLSGFEGWPRGLPPKDPQQHDQDGHLSKIDCEFWDGRGIVQQSQAPTYLGAVATWLREEFAGPLRLEYFLYLIRAHFDSSFDKEVFLAGAAGAFSQVRSSILRRDWDGLRACVSPRLLKRLQHQASGGEDADLPAGPLPTCEVLETQMIDAHVVPHPKVGSLLSHHLGPMGWGTFLGPDQLPPESEANEVNWRFLTVG